MYRGELLATQASAPIYDNQSRTPAQVVLGRSNNNIKGIIALVMS